MRIEIFRAIAWVTLEQQSETTTDAAEPHVSATGLDPIGLMHLAQDLGRAVPGARFVERQYQRIERAALRELAVRLDQVDAQRCSGVESAMDSGTRFATENVVASMSPGRWLEQLLRRSMDQTPAESLWSLADLVVHSIVPDEARILSALSDGSTYPLVHLETGRLDTARVLANASAVGRAAGVALPDNTPSYVTRLLQLGLVEVGPEDSALREEYEILMTDATVRNALGAVDVRVRAVRRTVRMSALGAEIWRLCRAELDTGSSEQGSSR